MVLMMMMMMMMAAAMMIMMLMMLMQVLLHHGVALLLQLRRDALDTGAAGCGHYSPPYSNRTLLPSLWFASFVAPGRPRDGGGAGNGGDKKDKGCRIEG